VSLPLSVRLQQVLPRRALTELMGRLAGAQAGPLTTAAIRAFVRRYGVNMAEAAEPDVAAYPTFNDFFTRALAPGARPQAKADLICPVDGAISQFGPVEGDRLFQAKGHHYTAQALLGGDVTLAETFRDGLFATLYLSPKDYHRIHMPCAGRLRRMVHVPGELYSVNPVTAQSIPGLFARNERVVCVFDSEPGAALPGPWVMVLVGATIVGSMATAWHGVVNPPRPAQLRVWDYTPGEVALAQGQEMGRFLLGSTVVLLFPRAGWRLSSDWHPGASIRVGEAMARCGP
jgi:phosphatidylserine decarboxylase